MFLRLFTLLLVAILAGCAHQGSVQQSGQDPYVAVDTSRTIDLTNPPADIWDRIRRGFAIPIGQRHCDTTPPPPLPQDADHGPT